MHAELVHVQVDGAWWGAGWIYGPDYLPTGRILLPGRGRERRKLHRSVGQDVDADRRDDHCSVDQRVLRASPIANYVGAQVPVVFAPTSIGTYQGDAGTLVDSKLGGTPPTRWD